MAKKKAPTEKWDEVKKEMIEEEAADPSTSLRDTADQDLVEEETADPSAEVFDEDRAEYKAAAEGERLPVEQWLAEKGVSRPIAAALMRFKRWGAGQKLTEAQFDRALAEMSGKPAAEV